MKKFFLLLCLATLLGACQRDQPSEPLPSTAPGQPPVASVPTLQVASPSPAQVTPPTKRLLVDGVTPVVVETPAEALPTWRQYASVRPTLLLLASDPSLLPYPERIKAEVLNLARMADIPTLRKSALPTLANPILLPNMALAAALDAGFFGKVIWLIPMKPDTTLTLEAFRARLVAQGILTETEAAAFRDEGGSFVGTVRNVPFTATTKTLPPQKEPLLLHLDLSYFRPGYHSEIREPLHHHVRGLLISLRESHLSVLATTVSLSNLSTELPLTTRFLGGMVSRLFVEPKRLDEALSSQEALRADAMYLSNFFRKEDVLEKYLLMEKAAPRDPSIKYDLYLTLRQFNRVEEAQEKLREAVVLDPIYGLEYLVLAELALQKERPDGALQMFDKAAAIFPENPFIPLYKARLYAQLGHPEKVKEILAPLQEVIWSDLYFPQMKAEVDGLLAGVK